MGLKLAIIIQVSEMGKPLFYADTDVLWFNDPLNDIDNFIQSDLNIHMSYDNWPGYDYDLIKKADLNITTEKPWYNAGMMFIKNFNAQQMAIIDELLAFLVVEHNNLSEQTIFANLQKKLGLSEMAENKYILKSKDQFDIIPTLGKDMVARHYTGQIRHLFWRDAFFKNFRWF